MKVRPEFKAELLSPGQLGDRTPHLFWWSSEGRGEAYFPVSMARDAGWKLVGVVPADEDFLRVFIGPGDKIPAMEGREIPKVAFLYEMRRREVVNPWFPGPAPVSGPGATEMKAEAEILRLRSPDEIPDYYRGSPVVVRIVEELVLPELQEFRIPE